MEKAHVKSRKKRKEASLHRNARSTPIPLLLPGREKEVEETTFLKHRDCLIQIIMQKPQHCVQAD